MSPFLIAPSILAADFARLGEDTDRVIKAGADMIHFDVMDHHYVPNLTFGSMVCKALREYGITAPIDTHLMTTPVDDLIINFAKAGSTYISIHPEATHHVDRSLELIHSCGCQAGIVLNPATPVEWLTYTIDKVDMILVMSVNPGFGGQKLIPSTFAKIKAIREIIDSSGRDIRLEVDGGITEENIGSLAKAGADTFVSGSAVFHSKDCSATINKMRMEIDKAIKS
ncbi:MAG TPA: ribulose-phosphate 3-epimerase [Spirochaetota bacterium]|nr:ribulose-phosphate 3-epimerase [Spirochaetota bacterium]